MKNERPRIDKNSPLNSRREKIGWVHHKKFTWTMETSRGSDLHRACMNGNLRRVQDSVSRIRLKEELQQKLVNPEDVLGSGTFASPRGGRSWSPCCFDLSLEMHRFKSRCKLPYERRLHTAAPSREDGSRPVRDGVVSRGCRPQGTRWQWENAWASGETTDNAIIDHC